VIGSNRWLAEQRMNDLARGRINVAVLCQVAQMTGLNFKQASLDGGSAAQPPQQIGQPQRARW
jgi:hypothetical protein